MKPIYTGQDKTTPQQWDNETLAQAINRHNAEKAERERLLADQGKLEGGLDTWTQEEIDEGKRQAEELMKTIKWV